MSTFTARYPGRCAGCDEPIRPGDQVRYDDSLVHDRCTGTTVPERPVEICPNCHLTRPCWCGGDL